MPDMRAPLKLGADLWGQYVDWPTFKAGVLRAEQVAEADRALVEHCAVIGRDEREIERSVAVGVPTIRDSHAQAVRDYERLFRLQGGVEPWERQPAGTPEEVFERLSTYVQLGYRHLIFYLPAPYDGETMTRLVTEVRPRLEAMLGT